MLELALALPLLLMVMALLMNYGTIASWKVRSLTVARHAAWGNRWPRNTGTAPRPANWPASGSIGHGGGQIASLDDARARHPVIRGELPPVDVDEDLFDPSRGMDHGSASLTRRYPFLSQMGTYHLEAHTGFLENTWPYHRTYRPNSQHWSHDQAGDGNYARRIPDIYVLPSTDPQLSDAFYRAMMTLLFAPYRRDLRPLDYDNEFRYFIERYWDPLDPNRPSVPNFVSGRQLPSLCSLDTSRVRTEVDRLIDRIKGVTDANGNHNPPGLARDMAQTFRNFFQRVIDRLNFLLGATPPPSGADQARMRSEIADLESKIQILDGYLKILP